MCLGRWSTAVVERLGIWHVTRGTATATVPHLKHRMCLRMLDDGRRGDHRRSPKSVRTVYPPERGVCCPQSSKRFRSSLIVRLKKVGFDVMAPGNGTSSLPTRLALLGYASYAAYLSSPHWSMVRRRYFRSRLVKRDANGAPTCSACGAAGVLHLHHRTYKSLGCERLNHLILLCETHHGEAHRLHSAGMSLWGSSKTRRLRSRK